EPRNPCGTRREISRRFRAWLPPRRSESARRRKGCPREERYMARRPMLWSMSFARMPFDPETYLTDVRMFHQEGFGAVYLIDDEQKAIIETGTSWDASKILEAVKTFGLQPSDIDALVVSHIHLDHAGGAGFLLSDMPRAKVYVHERACSVVRLGEEPRDVPPSPCPEAAGLTVQPLRSPWETKGRDRGDDGLVSVLGPGGQGAPRLHWRRRRAPRAVRHELSRCEAV